MNIENRTIVLTGASGGIGGAIAASLSAAGARLILVGRNEQKLSELVDRLGGQPHIAIIADLGQRAGRLALRNYCESIEPDGISLLINNAGINEFNLFEEQSQEAIENILATNLISPILICQDLLPLLRRRTEARIVNIGSTFGSIGYPGFSTYSASKFGLRGFTESLRRELADSAVRVSYVAPRATDTELNSDRIVAMNDELGTAMDKPAVVAEQLMRVINCGTPADKYLGWPEKIFVRINALLPALVDSNLRKQLPVIRRFAKQEI